jgi:hypothetical protein
MTSLDLILKTSAGKDDQKKNRHRRWSRLFEERITQQREVNERQLALRSPHKPSSQDTQSNSASKRIFFRPETRNKSGRLYTFVTDYLRILKHRQAEVVPLPTYELHLPHQILCHYCTQPCLSDAVACRSCSSVAHLLCLPSSQEDTSEFSCTYCVEAYQRDVDMHMNVMRKTKDETIAQYYAEKLGRRLLTLFHRNRFVRRRNCAIKVQALSRVLIARKRFLRWRSSQLRVLVLSLVEIPAININTGLVILSVFDTSTKAQVSRCDKTPLQALEEGFLIPGISSFYIIVLTFCACDTMIAQQFTMVCIHALYCTVYSSLSYSSLMCVV